MYSSASDHQTTKSPSVYELSVQFETRWANHSPFCSDVISIVMPFTRKGWCGFPTTSWSVSHCFGKERSELLTVRKSDSPTVSKIRASAPTAMVSRGRFSVKI
jgi:hypothetical protein